MAILPSNLTLGNSLYSNGFVNPNFQGVVISKDFGYNKLSQLAYAAGPSISVPDEKIWTASLGNLNIFSPVSAAPAANGSFLDVTVANGNGFRVGDIVQDKDRVQGRIESISGNVLTLSSLATTLTTSFFTVASTCKVVGEGSYNRKSLPKTGIMYTPEKDYTYLAVSRDAAEQSRRDRSSSNVMWAGNYWYHSWVDTLFTRWSKQTELIYHNSVRGKYNEGLPNEYNQTEGLRDAIIRNGNYMPLSSQMTLDDFNMFLETIRARTINGGTRLLALMGTNALGRLQQLVGDKYLVNTGMQNTFGGVAVEGINIMKYTYMGLEIEFAKWDLLDDPMNGTELSSITGRPMTSSSIYFIDMTPLPAADGSGMVNPIQRYHFNNDELICGYLPGLVGLNDSTPSQLKEQIAGFSPSLIASLSDDISFHILSDRGIKFHADNFGLIELTA